MLLSLFSNRTEADYDDDGDPNEPNSLYRVHMQEYECHLLRGFFLEEMARLEPGWVESFNKSELMVDLEEAVHYCDSDWGRVYTLKWIDKVNAKKPWERKGEGLHG